MKKRKLLLSLFCSLIFIVIIEYQKKTIYLTPEVTGYIYDSVTKKPLSNQIMNIGFNGLSSMGNSKVKLNIDGSFTINPITKTYYFFRPSTNIYNMVPAEIFFYAPKYDPFKIDYAIFYSTQVPDESRGYSHFSKINLGIIYLEPKKP